MKYFYNFLIGILIGFGAILPGVSSGVFCVIFGIYEKLLNDRLYMLLMIIKGYLSKLKRNRPTKLDYILSNIPRTRRTMCFIAAFSNSS